MTTSELVDRFASIALRQYDAMDEGHIALYNRLYKEMEAVREELRARPGDQRRALIALFAHENPQVRLKAATTTLALEPDASRQVIQAVRESREMHVGLAAGMIMAGLDDGSFVPTRAP